MPPDPNTPLFLAGVLGAIAALAFLSRTLIGLWRDIARPSGADAMTQAADRYQPRGDYPTRTELDSKLGGFREELLSMKMELDQIRGDISEAERRMGEASEERIKGVHQRLDGLPDRIIAQLSNLGVLLRPH